MFKGEPSSTNFDDDPEDGEVRSSPQKAVIEDADFTIHITKDTEIHIADGVVIDRTESIEIEAHETSENDVSNSEWFNSLRRGMLDNTAVINKDDDGEPKVKRTKVHFFFYLNIILFSMSACFNCGGDHQLSTCPEPKNPQRIREAANEFKEKKRLSEAARYHDNGSSSQKESNFRPGRLSSELRRALGIGPDDIPEWIYRMRRMGFVAGYPPGYLRQAVEVGRGDDKILKFHLVEDEHDNDETEKQDRDSPPPVLNDRKMYYFLGFNQTYRHLNDRERNFRVPPFPEFCRFHQDELSKNYWAGRKDRRRQKEEKRKLKEAAKELQEEGDVICVRSDFDTDDDVVVIDRNPTEPEEPSETSSSQKGVVKDIPLDQSNGSSNGESASREQYVGTPVMSRRSARGVVQNSLPSLEAFSKGITPFKAEEESTPHRGFLKRIFAKIKSVATSKK